MQIFNIINHSAKVSEADLNLIVEACKVQLTRDAAPLFGKVPWDVKIGGDDGFPIAIFDDADNAGALGYHTQDPSGKTWGRVFTTPILNNGGTIMKGFKSISTVLSHEILEAFYNPYVNLWANRGNVTFVAVEVCDPVESDCYEIVVNNVAVSVSNFVLDVWFDSAMKNAKRYDFLNKLAAPLTLSRGGYNVIFNSETGEVKSVFGSKDDESFHNVFKPAHPAARTSKNVAGKIIPADTSGRLPGVVVGRPSSTLEDEIAATD
jgi:hypothetical protein